MWLFGVQLACVQGRLQVRLYMLQGNMKLSYGLFYPCVPALLCRVQVICIQ